MSSSLTVSQALRQIRDLKGVLASHLAHAQGAVTYEEGAEPAYTFQTELDAARTTLEKILRLQARVAEANATTNIVVNRTTVTLAYAVRQLQEWKSQIAWYQGLAVRAKEVVQERMPGAYVRLGEMPSRSTPEVRVIRCALPEKKRDDVVRELQVAFQEWNDAVEQANHRTSIGEHAESRNEKLSF